MKRYTLFIASTLIACSAFAQKSQYNGPLPRTILKFSPQHMFISTLQAGAELFNEEMRFSHTLNLLVRYKPVNPSDYDEKSSSGASIEYMAKVYPGKFKVVKRLGTETPMGMYGGFFAQAGSYTDKGVVEKYDPTTFTYRVTDAKVTHTPFYFGFVIGRQVVISDFMYVDMHLGAGMRVSNSSADTYEVNSRTGRKRYEYLGSTEFPLHGFSGIMPKLGFTVGIGIQ